MSLFLFVDVKKGFDIVPCDKLWACLQRFGEPPHLQHVVKTMYIAISTTVQINGDTIW